MEHININRLNWDKYAKQLHNHCTANMGIEKGSLQDKVFLGLALAGEAGELANVIKKMWRDGVTPELEQKAKMEIADNLLYLLHLCDAFEVAPDEICIEKLDELYNKRRPAWADSVLAGKGPSDD